MTGVKPKAASAMVQEVGAEVIGFICGLMTKSEDTVDWYPAATALLKEVKEGTDRYLAIAPDAGLARLINGKTVYPASPEEMASEVPNWITLARVLLAGVVGQTWNTSARFQW